MSSVNLTLESVVFSVSSLSSVLAIDLPVSLKYLHLFRRYKDLNGRKHSRTDGPRTENNAVAELRYKSYKTETSSTTFTNSFIVFIKTGLQTFF